MLQREFKVVHEDKSNTWNIGKISGNRICGY